MLIKKIILTACSFLQQTPDQKYSKKYDTKILQDDELSLEINKEQPYAFVFLPNGSFWDNIAQWQKISISKSNAKNWTCVYLQFHNDSSISDMLWAAKDYGMPLPSFAIEDNLYVTFFYVFNEPMVRVDLTGFINYIHRDLAPFGANTEAASVTKEFSIPWSFDYSGWKKKEVLMHWFWINWDVLPFEENLFASIPKNHFQKLWNEYTIRSSYIATTRKKYNWILNETQVYQINMKDILIKDWYIIHEDGIHLKKWTRLNNMWYNPKTNWVSLSLLEEWAFGSIIEYLHATRDKSHALVDKFFRENFRFNIIEESSFVSNDERQNVIISTDKESVVFTDRSIKIQYIKKDWSLADSVVFKQAFTVLGRGKTHFDKSLWWELRNPETVIIIKKWKQIYTLNVITRGNKFNDIYNSIWLFCYWSDNMLKAFFQTLIESPDVPDLVLVEKSWYYGNACVLWDKVVYGELPKDHLVVSESRIVTKSKKEISVEEFYNNMRKIWTEDVASIALLQSAALHWMNMWHDMKLYPAIWISAWFKVGKSTLMECCQAFLGYDSTPIAMNSITPQPLSILWCDNAVIFWEEFTNIKNLMIENIFRNIINRIQWWRWFGTKNITYNFKANIFAAWESLPQSASLQSRFVSIRLKRSSREKCDNPYIQDMIKQTTCCEEISKMYIENKEKIIPTYHSKRNMLNEKFKDARLADVRAYVFTMREFFPVIEEKQLLKHMAEQVKNMGTDSLQSKNQKSTIKLQKCIMNAFMARKVLLTVIQTPNEHNYWQLVIQFQDDYYQQNKWEIIEIIQELASEWETKMSVDWSLIRIMIPLEATGVSQSEIDLFYMLEYVSKSTNAVKTSYAEAFD